MNKKDAVKTRTIPFVFSDETRDSYGTVLPASGWDLKYFNKAGVAFYNHSSGDADPDNVIGTARAWVDGKKLLGEITFESGDTNPKAEKVFQKLLNGTIKGCSVGFRPLERGRWGEGEEAIGGKNETYYYGKRELMEISVTPMPANPNAHVRSAEGEEKEIDTKQIDYIHGEVRAFDVDTDEDPKSDVKEEAEARELEQLRRASNCALLVAEATIAKSIY